MDDGLNKLSNDAASASDAPPRVPPRGFRAWLRRVENLSPEELMPPTLMARAGLAIVVPLILVQVISTYVFYDNHMTTVDQRMATDLAGDVAAVVAFLRDHPSDEDRAWIAENAKRTMDITVRVERGERLAGPGVVTQAKDADDALEQTLWDALHSPFLVDESSYRMVKETSIFVQLPNGLLHVLAPRSRRFTHTTYVFVIWMIGSSLLLFGVAAVFLRGQVESVRRLAQAADAFGKGREVPDFPPEGAFEVRQVARAFNIMRNRIKRQLAQRMEMLAGVSHDLRTPLTRMKLQLAMMGNAPPEDDVTALRDDLDEMERMLDAYLAFARGEGTEEATATDLTGLLETIVARFRREGAVVGLVVDNLPMGIKLKPTAFQRSLGNLIANAIRHGTTVDVSARRVIGSIEIYVDDDGPGIPADKREEVFRAFHRLEPSRNPQTGGVGLGLTVARDIIRGMGGDIILGDSPRGGLRATINIPI